MGSCNAARILKEQQEIKAKEICELNLMPIEERRQRMSSRTSAYRKAELEALMAVSEARDKGKIKKRNIKKIDSKVNDIVFRYVTEI